MTTSTINTHARRATHTSDREQLLSLVFLFAGPVVAFVVAVVFGW